MRKVDVQASAPQCPQSSQNLCLVARIERREKTHGLDRYFAQASGILRHATAVKELQALGERAFDLPVGRQVAQLRRIEPGSRLSLG